MQFDIDITSATPIYAQLIMQIKRAIVTGVLRDGEYLPSLREMSVQLRVNPLTVARAYRELDQMNIITTEHGKGSYITKQAVDQTSLFRDEALSKAVDKLLDEAHQLGVSSAEIVKILKERGNT
jgi:GntR family transcriptional regulator